MRRTMRRRMAAKLKQIRRQLRVRLHEKTKGTAESTTPLDMGTFSGKPQPSDPGGRDPASVSRGALCVQPSQVRTVCVRSARTDLCGGCRATGIPTATESP